MLIQKQISLDIMWTVILFMIFLTSTPINPQQPEPRFQAAFCYNTRHF